MAFGQQCNDDNVKCHLLRSSVPLTPKEGYALQNGSQQTRLHLNAAWKNGCHVTGSSFTMNADATISNASGLLTPELLEAWILHLPKLSLPDAVFQPPDIDLNNLNL